MKKLSKRVLAVILTIAMLLPMGTFGVVSNAEINIPSDAVMFNGNAYKVYKDSLSWVEAKEYCEKLGGHLATIVSEEEQRFIEGIIEDVEQPYVRLGACRDADNNFVWVTSEPFEYTNWAKGEPNNIRNSEKYLMLYTAISGFETGKWNDTATNYPNYKYAFVCEWENAQRYPDGYDPLKDKYPFTNPAHSISYDKFYNLFGALWGSTLYAMHAKDGNNGTCFGMAVTTGSLLKGYCSLDDISYLDEQGNKANPSCIHDVWNGSANHQDFYIDSLRMRVSDYIDYGFVYQWGPWELLIDNNIVDDIDSISVKNRLKSIYDDVYDYVYNDGEPVVINMLKNGSDGHTVLATGLSDGCTNDGVQYTEILIDDSNYLEERSIILFKNESGEYYDWYFEFKPGDIFKAKNAKIQGCNPCNMFSVAMKKMVMFGNAYNLCEDYRLILVEKDVSVENVSDLLRRQILWVPVVGFGSTENNSEQTEVTEQLYWMDRSYTEPLSFSTNDMSGCVEYANYESAVTINLPADSTCDMNTDENGHIIFTMTDTANKDIEFTHTTIDANGETVSLTVKGTAFSDVIGTETSDGVQVTGLNDITVTLETADGSSETSAKVTDGETVNITVDDPNNTVTTDWQCKHPDDNHDGVCDNCGEDFTKDCDCFCHSESKFMQFIYKIVRFLWKLFGIEDRHFCDCGKAHW